MSEQASITSAFVSASTNSGSVCLISSASCLKSRLVPAPLAVPKAGWSVVSLCTPPEKNIRTGVMEVLMGGAGLGGGLGGACVSSDSRSRSW